LKVEDDRAYNFDVLAGTQMKSLPLDVRSGERPCMAHRRKRLAESDITAILKSLKTLPITV